MSKKVSRLFQQFQPEHYELHILPDRSSMTFRGTVTISGKKVGRPSERITLHQKDLKIVSATITRHDKKGSQKFEVSRIHHHKSFDEVRLHSEESLHAGSYVISLTFEGKITRGMTGIYPCYFSHDGIEKSLIATQFESHHAREAFPCIDEPEAKSTFDLTLTTPQGETVLANTPIKSQSDKNKLTETVFETTPRMSSYLLAFVFGELQSKHTTTKRGTQVATWATVAQPIDSLDFALDVAKRSIEFFEDYFNVPYPLAKADHVALPDFSAGAMENWGLITYRERVLLAYPGDTSQSVKEQIALVIAHETSHQWFGNLVTMQWWNDLWLNESFANMMEYQAIDALFPEWHIWDTFVAQEGLSALRRDATPGVQSVRTDVNHPDEINTLFDPSIVYAKGGRLLYMLKNYIGEAAFRSGLEAYFKKHSYANTTGDDLWAALSNASSKDVGAFMNPWLQQPGFPVVSVSQKAQDVAISQSHFSDNPDKADPTRLWPVPLFSGVKAIPELLVNKSLEVKITDSQTVLINTDATAHYLVNYTSPEQIASLRTAITSGSFSTAARLMALNNGSMLARAGHQQYIDVLELLRAYDKESSEPVWDMISLIIGETRRFVYLDDTLETKIKLFVHELIAKEYARLGWDETEAESSADKKLRGTIIALGTYSDDPSIIKTALTKFEASKKAGPASLPSELRSIIYGVSVKRNEPGAVDYLLDEHDKTNNSDLKTDIAAALTNTRQPDVATRLLDRLKDPNLVKPQDADRWLAYLLRNRYVGDVAWDWMVANWSWIEETYKHDKSYDYLPRYAAGACNTAESLKRFKKFFEPMQNQITLQRNIVMGIEEIANRVAWLERDLASVQKFFARRSKS